MDNRPIGFFDSGLGGLTCIPHMMRDLPEEKIIYFGDTARTPYGSKAANTIRSFSMEIADFLVKSDVKMIVIACNTVSATCGGSSQKISPDPHPRDHRAGSQSGGRQLQSRKQDRDHRYESDYKQRCI